MNTTFKRHLTSAQYALMLIGYTIAIFGISALIFVG